MKAAQRFVVTGTLPNVRIILVEDVELEGKLLTRVFADRGFFDVVHARDTATALKNVDDSVPCVVIADVELGNGSGVELIQQIRARGTAERLAQLLSRMEVSVSS